jgi:hypothetical protein
MKVSELIEMLKTKDPDADIMVLDRGNGCGVPRDLNFGPVQREISDAEHRDCGDCENRVGEKVIVIGYCY